MNKNHPEITMQDIRLIAGEGELSSKTTLQAVNTLLKLRFPTFLNNFSKSKDWREGDYTDRIAWLLSMVENYREEISLGGVQIPPRLDILIEQLAEVFEDSYSTQNNWIQPISNLLREWKKLKRD